MHVVAGSVLQSICRLLHGNYKRLPPLLQTRSGRRLRMRQCGISRAGARWCQPTRSS